MQTDGGPENVGGEFTTYLKGMHIEHHVVAAEAAWKNGVVERHGGILKDMLLKTLESSPTLSVRAVLDHCVRAKKRIGPCFWTCTGRICSWQNSTKAFRSVGVARDSFAYSVSVGQ